MQSKTFLRARAVIKISALLLLPLFLTACGGSSGSQGPPDLNVYVDATALKGSINGTTTKPFSTLSDALTFAVKQNRTVVQLARGTYDLPSSLSLQGFTGITIQAADTASATADPSKTTIVSIAGSPLLASGACSVNFKGITILGSPTGQFAISSAEGSSLTFVSCVIGANPQTYRNHIVELKGGTLSFSACKFFQATGTGKPIGLIYAVAGTTGINGKLTMDHCKADLPGAFSYNGLTGVDSAVISNCAFNTVDYALEFGIDGKSALPGVSNFSITDSTFTSANGHAVMLGSGCRAGTVSRCIITGATQGIVVKEATAITVDHCTVTLNGLTGNALYSKGSTHVSFLSNTVTANGGWAFREGQGDTGDLPAFTTLTNNTLTATGTAQLLYWTPVTQGGAIAGGNTYSGLTFGQVRSHVVTSASDLKTAWQLSPFVEEQTNEQN